MPTKKRVKLRREISAPTIKNAYFKRGKLARVVGNYGASVTVNNTYTIIPPKTLLILFHLR